MRRSIALFALVSLVACDTGVDPSDAGAPDGGRMDAAQDAGSVDAGRPDADDPGERDAGRPDAGPRDAGPSDGGPPDAGAPDAGPPDAGTDAGTDAGPPPPTETQCADGTDDDGDGLTDCEDTADCGDHACVAAPPAGWLGPGVLTTSACEGAELAAGGVQVDWADVTCDTSACTCGEPTDQSCRVVVNGYPEDACGGARRLATPESDAACAVLAGDPLRSVIATSLGASAACALTGAPRPPVTERPAPSFTEITRLCARDTGSGCADGLCAATDPPSCIAHEGQVACPAEYPGRRFLARSTIDTRDCSGCYCTANGGTCNGTLSLFGSSDCSGTATDTVAVPATDCQTLSAPASSVRLDDAFVTGQTCYAGGGSPAGCVIPDDWITVCCEASAGLPACPSERGPVMVALTDSDGMTYCIDSTEVTFAQYEAFLATSPDPSAQTGLCAGENSSFVPLIVEWPPDPSRANQPVIGVDWCDAVGYCEWAGKRLCRSEWEDACERTIQCGSGGYDVGTDPCCYADGVFDLRGSVDEWSGFVDSTFDRRYSFEDCDRTDFRYGGEAWSYLGFRCCADPS